MNKLIERVKKTNLTAIVTFVMLLLLMPKLKGASGSSPVIIPCMLMITGQLPQGWRIRWAPSEAVRIRGR